MNTLDQHAGRNAAERAGHADRDGRARADQPRLERGDRQRRRRPLQRPPLHDGRASRRRRRTGSPSRPARATPTRASPPAPTTTRSPPRTRPATSGRSRTRRAPRPRPTRTPPTVAITVAERRAHGVRHARRHRERVRQRQPSQECSSSSTARTSGAEDTSSAVLRRLGHVRGGERRRHTLTAVARDARRQHHDLAPTSRSRSQNTGSPPGSSRALGFDEGSGTTTADQSGRGNTGTISNAIWVDGREVQQGALASTARTPGSPCPTPRRST